MEAGTIDYATAYRSVRDRVGTLVRTATDEQLDAIAPATPEWRTRDVLAHVVGVATDIVTGNIDGVATDPWTEAQVESRRDRPVAELLAEWDVNGAQVDPMIESFGTTAGQLIFDAVTHEHDIRGGLGAPGARDSDAVAISFDWMGQIVGGMRDTAEVGALRIESDAGELICGTGVPTATCRATRFELVRASTGRRSEDQMLAWDWDGEPRLDLLVMPIFTPRAEPLVE